MPVTFDSFNVAACVRHRRERAVVRHFAVVANRYRRGGGRQNGELNFYRSEDANEQIKRPGRSFKFYRLYAQQRVSVSAVGTTRKRLDRKTRKKRKKRSFIIPFILAPKRAGASHTHTHLYTKLLFVVADGYGVTGLSKYCYDYVKNVTTTVSYRIPICVTRFIVKPTVKISSDRCISIVIFVSDRHFVSSYKNRV